MRNPRVMCTFTILGRWRGSRVGFDCFRGRVIFEGRRGVNGFVDLSCRNFINENLLILFWPFSVTNYSKYISTK